MRYGIDLPLTKFKGRDSRSLVCLMTLLGRDAALRSRGGAGEREAALRSCGVRGGAVRNSCTTSKSELIRAVFNCIARRCGTFTFKLLPNEADRVVSSAVDIVIESGLT